MGSHDQILQFYQYNIMIVDLCSTVIILSSSLSLLYYNKVLQPSMHNCLFTIIIVSSNNTMS